MNLNDQRRIRLERSGPWIGVVGLFVMLWIAIASSQYAPWWGVLIFLVLLVPATVIVVRLSRSEPKRAAFVPLGSLVIWMLITVAGTRFAGWG